MSRRMATDCHLLRLDMSKGAWSRTRKALNDSKDFPEPAYVISAGHGTHLSLLYLARKFGACSILLMKPGLPVTWFDWCIAPEHDFKMPPASERIIVSKGALNRVVSNGGGKSGKLFLIGGPSKIHGYDENALIEKIRKISSDGSWQVADSRRTPETFLESLKNEIPDIEVYPHQETESGWLATKLPTLEEVWVTEDSVSMIYEALTSGAKVGILEMPRLRPDARVIRGLEQLKAEGYFTGNGIGSSKTLQEADRCAGIILGAEQ